MSNQEKLLNTVEAWYGNKDLRVAPAAFVELTGDIASAYFLMQCVYWSDKTSRKDGYFYKSRQEWYQELGLSKDELETCRKKTTRWVDTRMHRANGMRTVHYRVNLLQLEDDLFEMSPLAREIDNADADFVSPVQRHLPYVRRNPREKQYLSFDESVGDLGLGKLRSAGMPTTVGGNADEGRRKYRRPLTETTHETTQETTLSLGQNTQGVGENPLPKNEELPGEDNANQHTPGVDTVTGDQMQRTTIRIDLKKVAPNAYGAGRLDGVEKLPVDVQEASAWLIEKWAFDFKAMDTGKWVALVRVCNKAAAEYGLDAYKRMKETYDHKTKQKGGFEPFTVSGPQQLINSIEASARELRAIKKPAKSATEGDNKLKRVVPLLSREEWGDMDEGERKYWIEVGAVIEGDDTQAQDMDLTDKLFEGMASNSHNENFKFDY